MIFLLPYTIQLIVFWIWSNFILEYKLKTTSSEAEGYNTTAAIILIIVSCIKILTEIIQWLGAVFLQDKPWMFWRNSYLGELKNWLEIIGTGLIIFNCLRSM